MKKIIFAFLIIITTASKALYAAIDCDQATLQLAVSNAVNGDTITCNAGTWTWNGTVNITKAITLQGAGAALDAKGRPTSCSTVIIDALDNNSILAWTLVANKTSRLSGIEFQGGTVRTGNNSSSPLTFTGKTGGGAQDGRRFRVDHCRFIRMKRFAPAVYSAWGVIDHNFFDLIGIGIYVYNPGDFDFADARWAEATQWGSDRFVFVEDNKFDRTTQSIHYAAVDGFAGSRYVFRYNEVVKCWFEVHGTETSGRARGARASEVYKNNFTGIDAGGYIINIRSGPVLSFLNTATGYMGLSKAAHLNNERTFYKAVFGVADGTNPWDVNDPANPIATFTASQNSTPQDPVNLWQTVTVAGVNWTTNQWTGYNIHKPGCVSQDDFRPCGLQIYSNTPNTITYISLFPNMHLDFLTNDQFTINSIKHVMDAPGRSGGSLLSTNIVASLTASGLTATATTRLNHGFNTGDFVAMYESIPTNYRGTYAINVTGPNTFTYTLGESTTPATYAGVVTQLPAGWNNQITDPCYQWQNTENGRNLVFGPGLYSKQIRANEHYFDYEPSKPFDGTISANSSSVGVGLYQSRPACRAPGVSYWATDKGGDWDTTNASANDGELFQCDASNNWIPYYTPYPYPHPMVSGSVPPPPQPVRSGSTLTAVSCSSSDVKNALNLAQPGDIVQIPAGTCSWASQVAWTVPSSVTLQGAGSQTTQGGGDQTVIIDDDTTNTPLLKIFLSATGTFRMTGITIAGGVGSFKDNGIVEIFGPGTIRLDHLHWNNTTYSSAQVKAYNKLAMISGNTYGVIDHNILDLYGSSALYFRNGSGADGMGNDSWASDTNFGSSSFLFIEDNTVNGNNLASGGTSRISDSYSGSRVVTRFNTLSNTAGQEIHATGHSGDDRGARAAESYANHFVLLPGQAEPSFHLHDAGSGTSLVWGNTVDTNALKYGVTFNVTRKDNSTYCEDSPSIGWGYAGTTYTGNYKISFGNSPPCTGSSALGVGSNWDGNTDSTGYPALDQPGRGKGDLLVGFFPNKTNQTTGTIAWPHQAVEPVYVWMNTFAPAAGWGGSFYLNNSGGRVVADRDYYAQASGIQTSPTSPFNGATGAGWGTLANRPPTCTTGVGYFATDQGSWNTSASNSHGAQQNGADGVLYKCSATDTWTAYYTPYTYPHPLVSGSAPLPPIQPPIVTPPVQPPVVTPPTAPVTQFRLITLPNGSVLLSLRTNDPVILNAPHPNSQMLVTVSLPSGNRAVTLNYMPSDPTMFHATLSSVSLTSADLALAQGAGVNVAVGTITVASTVVPNVINPNFGGRAKLGRIEALVNPGKLTAEASLNILNLGTDSGRKKMLDKKSLMGLGDEIDFSVSSGSVTSATIYLPFDASLIPAGKSLSDARVAYFNPASGEWEIQNNVSVQADQLVCDVPHFSIYKPVITLPNSTPELHEIYVYPNPATGSDNPILHVAMGLVDTVEIFILDLSGQKVHSVTLDGGTAQIGSDGQYYYEYAWSDPKASGVYVAVVRGKTSDAAVKAKVKFAVIK